jgi:hypothetical protein
LGFCFFQEEGSEDSTAPVEAEPPIVESLSPTPVPSVPEQETPPSLQPISESSEDTRLVGLELDTELEEDTPEPKPESNPVPAVAAAAESVVPSAPEPSQAPRVGTWSNFPVAIFETRVDPNTRIIVFET